MASMQVIKVKYEGKNCRISAAKSANADVITFDTLEDRVRASFKLSPSAALVFTYTDCDGDVINLASNQDIVDALLYQQLNPLRVELAVVEVEPPLPAGALAAALKGVPAPGPPVGLVPSLSLSSSVSSEAAAEVKPVAEAKTPGASRPPLAAAAVSAAAAAAAGGAATPAPSSYAEDAVKDITDLVEKQLREVLGVSEEVGRLMKNYEPLLKIAPQKIAEVLDAALKSGLSVSFEPVLEHQGSSSTAIAPSKAEEKAAEAPAPDPAPAAAVAPLSEAPKAAAAGPDSVPAIAAPAVPAPAPKAASSVDAASYPAVHQGIICDVCDMNPIVGNRYKSIVKHDYDLCEGCFKATKANALDYRCHTAPVYRPSHRHGAHPHFRGPAWTSPCQPGSRPMRCGPPGPPVFGGRTLHQSGRWGQQPELKLEARFVTDVTIPDNMEVLPGVRFTKIWRMRNTGSLPWPQYTQIVHIGGDALGERNAVLLEMPSAGVAPDAEVDVSVDMVAPNRPGRYMSHWRLCAPGGPKFGHRIWVLIHVVSPGSVPAVPSFTAPKPSAPTLVGEPASAAVERKEAAPVQKGPAEEETWDPVIAAVAAAVPPPPVVEAPVAPSQNAQAEADPAPAIPPAAVPAPATLASASPSATPAPAEPLPVAEAVSASVPAVAEGYVEVPPAAPAPVPAAGASENTPVGNFSLVDLPASAEKNADCASSSEKTSDAVSTAGSVDDYVDAAHATGSAPNGKALEGVEKVKAMAAAARQEMFEVEDEEEAEILDELEGMGFEDRVLNREVLKKAGGKLYEAVEVLMQAAEWDPMLIDLEEMGFDDKVLNKRIMFKNDGNVKGTVKELVHLYMEKQNQ